MKWRPPPRKLPLPRRDWSELSDGDYLSLAASLGCLPCSLDGMPGTPAEIHHPRADVGMAERAPDKDAYPCCPQHHRIGMHTFSVHMQPQEFHLRYGSDERLTRLTRIGVQKLLDSTIGKRA